MQDWESSSVGRRRAQGVIFRWPNTGWTGVIFRLPSTGKKCMCLMLIIPRVGNCSTEGVLVSDKEPNSLAVDREARPGFTVHLQTLLDYVGPKPTRSPRVTSTKTPSTAQSQKPLGRHHPPTVATSRGNRACTMRLLAWGRFCRPARTPSSKTRDKNFSVRTR